VADRPVGREEPEFAADAVAREAPRVRRAGSVEPPRSVA
jgi:hypothetical protein